MKKLAFSYDPPPIDVLTIEGIKYSGELFRLVGIGPKPGYMFKIVKKDEDGIVHLKTYRVDEAEFEKWQEDWIAQEMSVAEMNRR